MIISKIDNISIDSSILDKINPDCISSRCPHRGCCCEGSALSDEDIKKIDTYITEILTELPPDIQKLIVSRKQNHGYMAFYTDKLRTIGKYGQGWSACIFLLDNKCLLEKYNITPLLCRTFPVTIENNTLKLNLTLDLVCMKPALVPAYISLEKEITLLTSKDFYNKLIKLLMPIEKRGLFFLRGY